MSATGGAAVSASAGVCVSLLRYPHARAPTSVEHAAFWRAPRSCDTRSCTQSCSREPSVAHVAATPAFFISLATCDSWLCVRDAYTICAPPGGSVPSARRAACHAVAAHKRHSVLPVPVGDSSSPTRLESRLLTTARMKSSWHGYGSYGKVVVTPLPRSCTAVGRAAAEAEEDAVETSIGCV